MGEEDFIEKGVTNGVDCFKVNLVKDIIEFDIWRSFLT